MMLKPDSLKMYHKRQQLWPKTGLSPSMMPCYKGLFYQACLESTSTVYNSKELPVFDVEDVDHYVIQSFDFTTKLHEYRLESYKAAKILFTISAENWLGNFFRRESWVIAPFAHSERPKQEISKKETGLC